ncbi:hypothetical protein Syn7502_03398 [Synechococcus sp. PCC 7502]|uniref:hypothetical protein n=1 Tax=Synechococcus sp. PCC 7502 TaxID=1173263 RepID=UPI00029FBFC8|nr:hypothetical protein [Synechococcus sp. PCC 7502]AFY75250.1 hypothetical protein Syn7502_03398 [Synechococcus sp. PCC 7502]
MSDRQYKQLSVLNYLEQVERPAVAKKPKPKVEREMYPNFAVGETVEYVCWLANNEHEIRTGKILKILERDWYQVDTLDGNQLFCSHVVIKKVREQIPETSELLDCSLTNKKTQNDHKSPPIYYEIKQIKGRYYRYARWREGKRLKSQYIGRA